MRTEWPCKEGCEGEGEEERGRGSGRWSDGEGAVGGWTCDWTLWLAILAAPAGSLGARAAQTEARDRVRVSGKRPCNCASRFRGGTVSSGMGVARRLHMIYVFMPCSFEWRN